MPTAAPAPTATATAAPAATPAPTATPAPAVAPRPTAPRADATPTRVDTAVENRDATLLPPMPEPPEGGILPSVRYFFAAVHGRYRRGSALRALSGQIQGEHGKLDTVYAELGRAARAARLESRPLADENRVIDDATARLATAKVARADIAKRVADEIARYQGVAAELGKNAAAAEKEAGEAAAALDAVEAERSAARDKRKEVERRQKGYLKGADDREAQAQKTQIGDDRAALRRSAEDLRGDAARLEPERVELVRLTGELDDKVAKAQARHDAARTALEATKRAVDDAGAGHRHRRAELQADDGRQARAVTEAEAEIGKHLVTLGTILNLNRVPGPELDPLFARIDAIKTVIAAREKDGERLEAERRQIDRNAVMRGAIVVGGALLLLIAIVCVLIAL